jgi:MFS superfamily sulfate permease-like transporter
MFLNLIYHFRSSQNQNEEFVPASYGVVYFFSDEGFLETSFLKEMSKSVPSANHESLTFLNLDDLKAFALRVSQELSSKQIRLISVQDYNIGLDGAKSLETFRSIFERYGEVVVNDQFKKKTFFGKLFS